MDKSDSVDEDLQWAFFELHFTAPRLRHYLTECGGNTERAIQLYMWDTDLSSAFWESLGHLEIALRNTIDRQMTLRQTNKSRSTSWIYDDARELGRDKRAPGRHEYPFVDVDIAKKRVQKNAMPLDPGQIISELSFGFWHQMVSKRQRFLWPDLAAAFPHMPGRNQIIVSDLVGSLRGFRNRLAHHHRIWSLDPTGRYQELQLLAGFIDPDLARWIDENSRVTGLLSQRP